MEGPAGCEMLARILSLLKGWEVSSARHSRGQTLDMSFILTIIESKHCPMIVQPLHWTVYGQTLYMDRHWTEIGQSLDKDWISCPMFVWPQDDQEYRENAELHGLPNPTSCNYGRHAYPKFITRFQYGRPPPNFMYVDSQGCSDGRLAYHYGFCDFPDFFFNLP